MAGTMKYEPTFKDQPKPVVSKAKTLTQAIDDIKKEAVNWGGEIVSEKVYESGGRMRQIEVKMVFKVH